MDSVHMVTIRFGVKLKTSVLPMLIMEGGR